MVSPFLHRTSHTVPKISPKFSHSNPLLSLTSTIVIKILPYCTHDNLSLYWTFTSVLEISLHQSLFPPTALNIPHRSEKYLPPYSWKISSTVCTAYHPLYCTQITLGEAVIDFTPLVIKAMNFRRWFSGSAQSSEGPRAYRAYTWQFTHNTLANCPEYISQCKTAQNIFPSVLMITLPVLHIHHCAQDILTSIVVSAPTELNISHCTQNISHFTNGYRLCTEHPPLYSRHPHIDHDTLHCTKHPTLYSKYPPVLLIVTPLLLIESWTSIIVVEVLPYCTHDNPPLCWASTNVLKISLHQSPTVLSIPRWTEKYPHRILDTLIALHPPMHCVPPTVYPAFTGDGVQKELRK